jgi:hypothetical protein
MAIGGPTDTCSALPHDQEAVRVSEREFLITELFRNRARVSDLIRSKRGDGESRQCIHEREKLHCPVLVVPAQEPAVPFGDHQGGSREGRRVRKEAAKQAVVAIGTVKKCD